MLLIYGYIHYMDLFVYIYMVTVQFNSIHASKRMVARPTCFVQPKGDCVRLSLHQILLTNMFHEYKHAQRTFLSNRNMTLAHCHIQKAYKWSCIIYIICEYIYYILFLYYIEDRNVALTARSAVNATLRLRTGLPAKARTLVRGDSERSCFVGYSMCPSQTNPLT